MALKVGELFATLNLDESAFSKGLKSARQSLDDLAAKLGKIGTAASLALTTPLTKAGKEIISAGSAFDATMSEVEAISGATAKEMERLSAVAKEMGAETVFSASQSGEALKYMAMAGWDTEKMISGLPGIINLAAASGEELADVSDIVTDALTAFGMQAEDSTRFADILAATASSANTNVGLMGNSFKYAAAAAGALNYSAADVALALGLMANAGIKGEMAGTQLRSGMLRLAKPTDDMVAVMDKYKLSMTNADGSMKSFMEMMQMYRSNLGGLTEAQQAQAVATLFGTEAAAGWLSIINASDDDFNKLAASIANSEGAAERMSKTMIDNLSGDVTLFKSALEGAAIGLYNLFSGGLRSIVQAATRAINWFSALDDGVKKMIVRIGVFAAAIGPAALALSGLAKGMSVALGVVGSLLNPVTLLAGGLFLFYKNSAKAQAIVAKLKRAVSQFFNSLGRGNSILGAAAFAIRNAFGKDVLASVQNAFAKIRGTVASAFEWIKSTAQSVSSTFNMGVREGGIFNGIISSAKVLGVQVKALMVSAWRELKQTLGRVDWNGIWDRIKDTAADLKEKLKGAFKSAVSNVSDLIGDVDWTAIWAGISDTYTHLKSKVMGVLNRIPEIINELMADAGNFLSSGTFGRFADGVIDLLAKGIESKAGGGVARIIGAITGLFESLDFEGLGEIGIAFSGVLIDALVKGIGAAASGASALIEAVGNLLERVNWADLGDSLNKISAAILDGIVRGLNALMDGGAQILGAISGMLETINWAEVGASLGNFAATFVSKLAELIGGESFAEFIENMGIAIGNAAGGLITAAKNLVTQFISYMLTPDFWVGLGKGLLAIFTGIIEAISRPVAALLGDIAGDDQGGEFVVERDLQFYFDGTVDVGKTIDMSRYAGSGDAAVQWLIDNGYLTSEQLERYDYAVSVIPDITFEEATGETSPEVYQRLLEAGLPEHLREIEAPVKMKPVFETDDGGEIDFGQTISDKLEAEGLTVEAPVELSTVQSVELGADAVEKFGAAGTEAGTILSTNAGAAITANTSGITGALDALTSTIRTQTSSGMNSAGRYVGQMLSEGIASGIRAGRSSVINAAKAVVQAAIDAANQKAEIGSPSKVTTEMGKYWDQGWANGILRNSRIVTGAASYMVAQANSAARIGAPRTGLQLAGATGTNAPQIPIDYDRLADAMNERQMILSMNDRVVARVQARETARAQNARNKRIALGYGK